MLKITGVKKDKGKVENKKVPSFNDSVRHLYGMLISEYSSKPHETIFGREKERKIIEEFLESSDSAKNLLYICGHPGQGKTALLEQVLRNDYENLRQFKYVGTTFETLEMFYKKLLLDLQNDISQKRNKR